MSDDLAVHAEQTAPPLLEVSHVSKTFGSTRALKDVSLTVAKGEVVALVGENGAGKSTLGKLISGVHQADEGEVRWRGEMVSFRSTSEALKAGIAIVLQEFNLIPEMTVAENVFLTRPDGYRWGFWRDGKRQRQATQDVIHGLEMDFGISPDAVVGDLSIAQQQIVEIVRSLSVDAELFVLDEPTATLGRRETEGLLRLIKRLRADGRSVIIVTHRLDEVYAVADRIFVLRDGAPTGEFDPATTDTQTLVRAMVGRELDAELQAARQRNHEPGDVVLDVRGLTVRGVLEDVDLTVRRGEVVGLAGLVGSGRTEVVRAIFGADRATSGTVTINGRSQLMRSPADGLRNDMALVPENRKEQGLHLDQSIAHNAQLSYLARRGGFWLKRRELDAMVDRQVEELRLKAASTSALASSLSGGNQQKVVLAKWLLAAPDLLILDEPTRGIDVGARADFYRVVDELVADGMAVLVISSELPEVIAISDRIVVMSRGRVAAEIAAADATEESILAQTEIAATA